MAAISHAYTSRRAAQTLDRDEVLLWDISDQLGPENGMLWILDADDRQLLASTRRGVEPLQKIIADQVDRVD